MNFVEQDFELGFALFRTPASFLMGASLIPCASFAVGVFYFGGGLVIGLSFYGV